MEFSRVIGLLIAASASLIADDRMNVGVTKEHHIPQTVTKLAKTSAEVSVADTDANYKAFTGRILGGGVRMRLHADVDSSVVKELAKNDLVVVRSEKADFYAVEPPSDLKVYIFRRYNR